MFTWIGCEILQIMTNLLNNIGNTFLPVYIAYYRQLTE